VVTSDSLLPPNVYPQALAAVSGTLAVVACPWSGGSHDDVRVLFTARDDVLHSQPINMDRDGKVGFRGGVSLVPNGDGVDVIWLDQYEMSQPKHGHQPQSGRPPQRAMTLRAAYVDRSGAVSREVEIDERTCDCCNTAAVAVPGGALVAYRDRDKKGVRDIALTRLHRDKWSKPRLLHSDGWRFDRCWLHVDGRSHDWPANGAALNARGARVAGAWFTMSGDRSRVLAAFSSDGGDHFGKAISITTGDAFGLVDIALTADGSALVSWLEEVRGVKEMLYQVRRVSPAGVLADPIQVASVSYWQVPKMVVSGDRVYFAWVDRRGVRTASARIP
jgi:hypothetical protein